MVSSLFGYYNSVRAMQVNQAALNIVNNNIANMNTEGYSKQSLDLEQNVLSTNTSNLYELAQSGGGADIQSISRNREAFLDNYYRNENSTMNYYDEYSSNVKLIESITNELGTSSISSALSKFYAAAQKLTTNPSDSVVRNNFLQASQDLCIKFNQTSSQLTSLRESIAGDVNKDGSLELSKVAVTCEDLNQKLKALTDINKNIALTSSQGLTPNGLLDQRDLLLDQISSVIPVSVETSSGNLVTVKFNGTTLVGGTELFSSFKPTKGLTNDQPAVVQLVDPKGNVIVPDVSTKSPTGTLGALLDISGSSASKLNINNMLKDLNNLATNFASEVNAIQRGGQYIDAATNTLKLVTTNVSDGVGGTTVLTTPASAAPFDLFVNDATLTQVAAASDITAANITISSNILNDPFKIAAARSAVTPADTTVLGSTDTIKDVNAVGDSANALILAQLRTKTITALNKNTTEGFLTSLSGRVGVQSQSINDKQTVQSSIMSQIETKRASVSGVNLDEELSDLIKYQRAYEASAKVFSTVDAILKTILGLAG